MENLFNINQAAFILKVHPLTIRRYIKEQRLKAVKVGGNLRIKESELQNFHKDFSPAPKRRVPGNKIISAKVFTLDDPLFRLKGRGASLHMSG